MTQTIPALFDSYAEAEAAVRRLEAAGVPAGDISLVANNSRGEHALGAADPNAHVDHGRVMPADGYAAAGDRDLAERDRGVDGAAATRDGDAVGHDAGAGAGVGAILGGAGGLLAGLGALAIPGIGPVVALGWLASTAVGALAGGAIGAAAGGLVGALTQAGVPKDDADAYAEGVRRGGVLVTVKAQDDMVARVQDILSTPTRVDIGQRRAAYVQQGWTRFDADAQAYTSDEIAAERARYGRV